jgi:hypothetical protein
MSDDERSYEERYAEAKRYESELVNLADIIGRPEPTYPVDGRDPVEAARYSARRIVDFHANDDGSIDIGECCDEAFGTTLTPDEVDKLIAWLTKHRRPSRVSKR